MNQASWRNGRFQGWNKESTGCPGTSCDRKQRSARKMDAFQKDTRPNLKWLPQAKFELTQGRR